MIISPEKIYKYLDQHVAGQEEAKRMLAYTGFMHYLKNATYYLNLDNEYSKPFSKTISLLTGPTGCGKTYMVSLLAKYMEFPFIEIDCTSITREGYVGESIADKLGKALDGLKDTDSVSKSCAVVFLDEIDKICIAKDSQFTDWNQSLQASLLKLIEGTEFTYCKGTGSDRYVTCKTSTHNLLFVCAGNFPSLRETKRTIGFNGLDMEEQNSRHQQLMNVGMTPELAGRISLVGKLDALTEEDFKAILFSKEDSVWMQYQKLFDFLGIELELNDDDIKNIAQNCIKNGTGARGIQTELDRILIPILQDEEIKW